MSSTPESKAPIMSTQIYDASTKDVSHSHCSDRSTSQLTESGKSNPGDVANRQSGNCPKHKKQILSNLCTECCQLICNVCLRLHSGHDLQPLKDDPKIYKQLCSRQIQHLLDELHAAEDMKSVFESQITVYDDASVVVDKWELDLLQMVKTKASRLRQTIKDIKNDKAALLSDRINGLNTKIHEIDQTISKLTDIRKSMDSHLLSNELAQSQSFIAELESYKEELRTRPPEPSVERILPNENKFKDVENDIDAIFSISDIDIPVTVFVVTPNPPQPPTPTLPGPDMAQLMTPGTRVERGDDWMWRSNDHGGTVTSVVDAEGWVFVKWDNGSEHKYCMGAMGRYELKLA